MSQVEKKLEQLESLVGYETSNKFEQQVTSAILDLASELQNSYLDNDSKVSYATHVFARVLDDLADIVEQPLVIN
ncbi:MAG: hypothetical protein HQM14_10130 [SAR324 cluster bacterium]|nr:hypothetical protein [SAR324 cluster bacterium]